MSEQPFTFLPLSYTARPPRLVVVAPQGAHWVRWATAALRQLSKVWGCSGSVVVPAGTVDHPAIQRALARLQPDHVLAYAPSWATAEEIDPGLIARVLQQQRLQGDEATAQFEQLLREQTWNAPAAQAADAAAGALRSRIGASRREDYVHVSHLFDDENGSSLTSLADVTTTSLIGVPTALVTGPAALAYAMHVGLQDEAVSRRVEDAQWQEAAVRGEESPLLSQLHPEHQSAVALRSHEAGLCVPIRRAFQREESVVVLGSAPEDFALAELLRQVHGPTVWIPWDDPVHGEIWLFSRARPDSQMKVTSASLDLDSVQRRIDASWDARGIRMIEPPEERPYGVVEPDELDLHGRSMVVLREAWEQPRSLPASVAPDGSLHAALPLAGEVPPGLDASKHHWQVTLIAGGHPVPPLPSLMGSVVVTPDESPWHTFARAADGGITYWSHRFDFVPSGASLAGTLAAPKLSWPGIKRVLEQAAAVSDVQLRPSPAGKRAAITERLLGSRAALEDLAASPGWSLLRCFMPADRRSGLPEESWWKLKSAVVLSWEAIAAYEHSDWNAAARRAQVDAWTSQGVLRRGLVLGCGHCPIYEFYPLTEISQDYRCRRCGGDNSLVQSRWKSPLGEPRWFYELHPAVLELVSNDGDVPLLATRHLRSQHWARPALVGEEFELLRDGSSFVEIDFALATPDDLWLGEAKKGNTLGATHREIKREACKLIDGCEAVGAVGLVLATAKGAWSTATVEVLDQELRGRHSRGKKVPRVQLLTGLGSSPAMTPVVPT
ncbi:hypothetical protein [Streptomyces wuyuanensis]|uniref:hypothetical protein n=1 Tax=Streptomyces wuyuanensis TaxID=1196353 RepID=UPI00382AAA9C